MAGPPAVSIRSFGVRLLREGLDAVYPPACLVCGRGASGPTCGEHALPSSGPPGPRCGRCALRLAEFLPDGTRCASCRRRLPRFRRVVTLGDYRSRAGLRDWVLALKHGGRPDLAAPLGRALGRRLSAAERSADGEPRMLAPVPLHPLRRLERGYDQAELLAAAVGEETGLRPGRLLRRVRWTPPQGGPGATSRRANVRGAFVPTTRARRLATGCFVWLVDDVVTSGATAEACAAALAPAGVRGVGVLCIARAGECPGSGGVDDDPRLPSS